MFEDADADEVAVAEAEDDEEVDAPGPANSTFDAASGGKRRTSVTSLITAMIDIYRIRTKAKYFDFYKIKITYNIQLMI